MKSAAGRDQWSVGGRGAGLGSPSGGQPRSLTAETRNEAPRDELTMRPTPTNAAQPGRQAASRPRRARSSRAPARLHARQTRRTVFRFTPLPNKRLLLVPVGHDRVVSPPHHATSSRKILEVVCRDWRARCGGVESATNPCRPGPDVAESLLTWVLCRTP